MAGVIANVAVGIIAQIEQFKKDIAEVKNQVNTFGDQMSALGKKIASIWASLALLKKGFEFAKDAVKAFAEREMSIAKLNQTLISTGNTAGYTTGELVKMAQGFMKVSTYSTTAILDAQGLALIYSRLNHEIFPRFVQVILDAGVKLDKAKLTDMVKSFGKALEEPYKGLGRLSRAGIVFTETQKAQIKLLMEQNKGLEAQKMIMTELERKFAGQALAALNTYSGAVKHLNNMWTESKVRLGAELVPTLKVFISMLTSAIPTIETFFSRFMAGIAGLGAGIVTFVRNYQKANGTFRSETETTANGMIDAFVHIGTATNNIITAVVNFGNAMINTMKTVANVAFDVVQTYHENKLKKQYKELDKVMEEYAKIPNVTSNKIVPEDAKMLAYSKKIDQLRTAIQTNQRYLDSMEEVGKYEIKPMMPFINEETFKIQNKGLIDLLGTIGKIDDSINFDPPAFQEFGDGAKEAKDKMESLNKEISKFKDFFNNVSDVVKEGIKSIIEYNFKVWEGTYNNLLKMVEDGAKEQQRVADVFFSLKMEQLDEEKKKFEQLYADKNQLAKQNFEAENKLIEDQMTKWKKLTDDAYKQQEIDHQGRLRMIDSEAKAKMDDLDRQIKAIDDLTEAEDKAQRSADRDERLAELRDQMSKTTNQEEYNKLLKEYNKEIKSAKREEVLENRELAKEQIRNQKNTVELIKQNLITNEDYKYNIIVDNLKKQEIAEQESFNIRLENNKLFYDSLIAENDIWLKTQLDSIEKVRKEEEFAHKGTENEIDTQKNQDISNINTENEARKKAKETALDERNLNKAAMDIIMSGQSKKWLDENYPGWNNSLKSVGEMLYDGIIKGMTEPANMLKGLQEFYVNFMTGFKEVFDAHSPSKKMKEFSNIAIGGGIAEGLNDSIVEITNAADNLATAIKSPFDQVGSDIGQKILDGFKSKLNFQNAPQFRGDLINQINNKSGMLGSDGKYIMDSYKNPWSGLEERAGQTFDSWSDYQAWGKKYGDDLVSQDRLRIQRERTQLSMNNAKHDAYFFGGGSTPYNYGYYGNSSAYFDPSEYGIPFNEENYNAWNTGSTPSSGTRQGGTDSTPTQYAIGTLNVNSPQPLDPYETGRQTVLAMQRAGDGL